MKSNIFIPEKINVGFDKRNSTYTGMLAYIIYFDEKGVLRKEKSWQGWRDQEIPNQIFDNIPTSGFVLNKKVGDYVSDWNHRQAYVRVYDPRDFEFEITIENLLYILENANSIKGKGLEGDFVYGWHGKDLVLIPTSSPDYKEISEYNEILHSNSCIKPKDLIVGATYKTNKNNELIYMGKFDTYYYDGILKGKQFWFYQSDKDWKDFVCFKSIKDKLISCTDDKYIDNYADLFDLMECRPSYSPYDDTKDIYELRTLEDFKTQIETASYWREYQIYGKVNDQYLKLKIKRYCDLTDDELKNKNGFYVRLKDENDFTYEYDSRLNYWSRKGKYVFTEPLFSGSLEEIYEYFKPSTKCEYLTNNKLYRKEIN
jgi:hypothetical protein